MLAEGSVPYRLLLQHQCKQRLRCLSGRHPQSPSSPW